MAKTFDIKCFELAEQFMLDVRCPRDQLADKTRELASRIQDAIEDWMSDNDPDVRVGRMRDPQ